MKEHEKCPKCGARKIFMVSEVRILSDDHEVVALPVALALHSPVRINDHTDDAPPEIGPYR